MSCGSVVRCLFISAALAAGCAPLDGLRTPSDLRVVKLTYVPPASPEQQLGGTNSIQLAAVRVEQGQVVEVKLSTAVDPRTAQTLSVAVARGGSFNLLLQFPRGSTAGLGTLVGRIRWSGAAGGMTSRLPEGNSDVDLGEVQLQTGSPATLADNLLLVPDDSAPPGRSDRDGDGTPDATDTDDDGDGQLDGADEDADGDGHDDATQVLEALPDQDGHEDGDGVPDDLEG